MKMLKGMRRLSGPEETEALYNLAAEHGHTIDFFPMKTKALSIEDEGRCYIALRPDLTGCQEREALAHELGHCEYGGFYYRSDPNDIKSRHEFRADKWAFLRLLPPGWVRSCIRRGICAVYSIAEEAGVSCEFAEKALAYYHQVGII